MAGAVLIPFAQDPPRDWMTNNGLFNDKRPIVMSGLMIVLFWLSMLIEPLRSFYELTPLGIVGILVALSGFLLWLVIIRAWWRSTAGLSERLAGSE